ncbi:MAG: ABC transporter permease [Candidatus Korarchaeota archaeon]|nr:ABC transporter permease [Candidatus Korarchaeota archaeon]
MPKALINIVKKELKEIVRDPRLFIGMILIPILIFPIMGLGLRGIMESAMEPQEVTIAVLNLDEGNIGEELFKNENLVMVLHSLNVSVVYLNDLNITTQDEAIDYLISNETLDALFIIPRNFTASINSQVVAKIDVYLVLRDLDGGGTSDVLVQTTLETVKQLLINYIVLNMDPTADPQFITNPLVGQPTTIYKGKEIRGITPSTISGLLFSQVFMWPISMILLLTMAIQFAATSVASEKEQKTLETLLTLPVKRTTILFGKLTGSIVISLVGAVGYILGFNFYMSSLPATDMTQEFSQEILQELGLTISPIGYVLLGLMVFLSILAVLALTLVVAAFAEDVRSAQSLVGIITLPMFIFGFIAVFMTMFGVGKEFLLLMLAIPFTSPMVGVMQILQGNYFLVLTSLGIVALETIGFIYLAAWFYSSEKILTAKLSFKRRKKQKEYREEGLL